MQKLSDSPCQFQNSKESLCTAIKWPIKLEIFNGSAILYWYINYYDK